MKMYLAAKPEWKGDGVLHFYDGELHIHEGVVDVNPKKKAWIDSLSAQGWAPLVEEEQTENASEAAPVETEKPRSSAPPRRKRTNKA